MAVVGRWGCGWLGSPRGGGGALGIFAALTGGAIDNFSVMLLGLSPYINASIITRYQTTTRSKLFALVLKTDWSFLSRQKAGYLEQVLTTDVMNSSSLLANVNNTIVLVANLLIYLLLAVNISSFIAILTLVLGAVVFLFFKPLFHRNRVLSEQIEKMYKQMTHFVRQCHEIAQSGDMILVKGSRGMKMEKVFECFITSSTR